MWGDGGSTTPLGGEIPDWTNGHDGVCCRASSTYSGRRSPSALVGHPPRDHAYPNNNQAWASVVGGGDPGGSTATMTGSAMRRGALQGHSQAAKELWPPPWNG